MDRNPSDPGPTAAPRDADPVKGGLVMFGLALLLSWIPVIGPFIGGFVGGRMTGSTGRAVGVSIIPAIVLGILVAAILSMFSVPIIGAVAGIGLFLWVLLEAAPVSIGAAVGGATAEAR